MERRKRLERKTPMRRGDKGLKKNREQQQEWINRSRRRLPAKSAKRIAETPERQALVAEVLAERPICEARIPGICTNRSTEVNEVIRRSQWRAGYLVKGNTTALCHNCHAFITAHPGPDGWACRHGHQIESVGRDDVGLVGLAHTIRLSTAARCGASCLTDHRMAA